MKTALVIIVGLLGGACCGEPSECIKLAMPLLSENELVVPSTRTELKMVCNKWHEFVDCINSYVASHYSSQQKSTFNQGVETAVKNVYKMCKDPVYSEEYLAHAPCIKQMTTDRDRCGVYYTNMARAVTEGIGSDHNICCLHHKFRSCMREQGPCESSRAGPAVVQGFVETFLDNGLHVFKQKCNDMQYVFQSDHCAGVRQFRQDDSRPSRPDDMARPRPAPPQRASPQLPGPGRQLPGPGRQLAGPGRQAPERAEPGRDSGRPAFVEQQLEPEQRGQLESGGRTTRRPAPRGSTTPYSGWFRPETTTSVWLDNNSLDDRAQARRQDSAAPSVRCSAALVTLTAALLAAAAAR